MSYKRVVEKKGKSYGPYIYESYRDKDGKVRKRYLGKLEEPKKLSLKFVFSLAIAALFLLIVVGCSTDFFLNEGEFSGKVVGFAGNTFSTVKNSITGLVVDGGENPSSSTDSPASSESYRSGEGSVSEVVESTETSEAIKAIPEGSSEEILEEAPIEELNETTLVEETESVNETLPIEENETISVPNENLTESINETISVPIENVTDILNETILNETILNETILNETILNETIINETLLNETEIILAGINSTTFQYRAVINRPVKWIKKVNMSDASNMTIELPRDSENISVLTNGEVALALEQIDEYEKVVDETDREGLSGGSLITGNVVSDIRKSEGILTRFWKWLSSFTISGNVILEEELSGEIVDNGDSVTIDLEGIVDNGTEVALEYSTPAPVANESVLTNGKRVVVSADDEYNYTDILAYTLLDNMRVKINDTRLKLYWYASYDDAVRYGYISPIENETEVVTLPVEEENVEIEVNETVAENITEIVNETSGDNVIELINETVLNENESVVEEEMNTFLTGNVILGEETDVALNEAAPITPLSYKIEANYVAYDFDDDGYVDYIEWLVPHLSVQIYEIVLATNLSAYYTTNGNNVTIIVNATTDVVGANTSTFINFDNSLVSWWRMEEATWTTGAGEVKDVLGRNNGTSVGGANTTTSGYFGRGGSFDGASDYLSITNSPSINFSGSPNLSISAWIKLNYGGNDDMAFISNSPNTSALSLSFGMREGATNRTQVQWGNGTSSPLTCSGTTGVLNNAYSRWVFVVMTANSTTIKQYVDGIQTGSDCAINRNLTATTSTWEIGRNYHYVNAFSMNGSIDDLMIWNRSLSANEISALYGNTSSKYLNQTYSMTQERNYTFTAYGQDTNGSLGTTGNIIINRDVTVPSIVISSPANTTYSNSSVLFNISSGESGRGSIIPNLDNSLVSWWRMDDLNSTGGVVDYMGRYNGTSAGNATQVGTGYFGEGFSFDGNQDWVDLGDIDQFEFGTNPFAISAWYNAKGPHDASDIGDYGVIVSKYNWGSNGRQWFLRVNGTGHPLFFTSQDGVNGDSLSAITGIEDQWVHVVAVANGTNKFLYVNGVLEANSSYSGVVTGKTCRVYVGVIEDPTHRYHEFNGSIDDVMIFNRSLTSDEVLALYNASAINHNSTLSDGGHSLTIYSQDRAGNVNSSSVIFGVDVSAPRLSLINPTASGNYNALFRYEANVTDAGNVSAFLDYGLVSWWRMDDSNSTHVFDYFGMNNLTITNAVSNNSGRVGKAFSFDGNGDYVQTSSFVMNSTSVIYGGWFKLNSLPSEGDYNVIMQQADASDAGYELYIGTLSGTSNLYCWNGLNSTLGGYSLQTSIWYSAYCMHNETGVCLYVNGNLSSCVESASTPPNNPFVIGGGSLQGAYWLNGSVDEVMIWNRTLSLHEIQMLYGNQSSKYLNISFSDGVYPLMRSYAVDNFGNINRSSAYFFTIDSQFPLVSFVSPTRANNYSSYEGVIPLNLTSIELSNHYSLVDFNGSLVGWWRGEGDARDEADSYLKLDGAGDYVGIGSASEFNVENKTISVWAKQVNTTNLQGIFSNTGGNYYTAFNGGVMRWSIANATGAQKTYSSNSIVEQGVWHLYTWRMNVTGTNVTVSFFRDGVHDSSFNLAQGISGSYGGNYLIGAFSTGSFYFNGSLDNLMVFNRTLSDTDITELYQVGRKSKYDGYSGLVSAWMFDDSYATTAADAVGVRTGTYAGEAKTFGGNNGTFIGQTSITLDGKFGSAFSFDGDGDFVQTSSPIISGNKYSYGGWAKFNDIGEPILTEGLDVIMLQDSGVGDGTYLYVSQDYFACGNPESEAGAYVSTLTNQWYHLMCVSNGTEMSIYVDGVFQNSYPTSYLISSATPFEFGGSNNWGGDYFMNGSIDEAVVFNRALNASEISSLYNASANRYETNFTSLPIGSYAYTGYAVNVGGRKAETEGYKATVRSPILLDESKLIAYWNFDDDPSDGYNDTRNSTYNTFLVNGGVTQESSVSKYGSSVKFNGAGGYLNLSRYALPDQGNLTVTFWVYNDNFDAIQTWMSFTQGSTFKFNAGSHTQGSGRTIMRSSGNYIWENNLVDNNAWSLVTIILNGTGQVASTNVYLNRQRQLDAYYDPIQTGYKDSPPVFSGSQIILGKDGDGTSYFDGYIDDLRIYNKTLNTSEVVSLRNDYLYSFNTSISTCEDFIKTQYDRVTETYNVTNNVDCGMTNPLNANYSTSLWNSSVGGWYPFSPIYLNGARINGNGHILSDLYMNYPTSAGCGLFSSLGGSAYYGRISVIDSLNLRNYNISCLQGGGLTNSLSWTNITNSSVTGTYYDRKTSGDAAVGGMIGYAGRSSYVGRSWANVTIISSGGTQIGGLAGTWDARNNVVPMIMEDCYSYSTITGATTKVGVLIGDQMDPLSDVYRSYCSGNYRCIGNEFLGGDQFYVYCDSTRYSGCASYSVTAKTSTELKQQATYSTYNFTNVWEADEGNSYPHLRWEGYFQPLVNLVSPSASYWQESNNVSFNYTVLDDMGISSCDFYLDGVLNFTNSSVTSWDNPFNLSVAENQSHTWMVSCNGTDGGRRNSTTNTFYVGSITPTISVTVPGSYAANHTVNQDFNWTVSSITPTNFTCNLSLDGAVNKSNIFVVNGQGNSTTISGISEGNHLWNMTCYFLNDFNIYATIPTRYLIVDSFNPNLTIVSPTSLSTQGTSIFLNVSVEDSSNTSLVVNFNNSLVSWWRMDEVLGNSVQDLVGVNHGVCYNTPIMTNLALGKNAYESTNYGGTYPASYAVDGSLATFQHTGTAANEWWSVDLGAVYDVTQINLIKRSGYPTRPYNYKIQSADDVDFTVNVQDLVTKVSESASSINFSVVDFGSVVSTQYLRVYDTASEYLNIAEFQVYNTTCNSSYGKFGSALTFDGVDQNVRVLDTANFTFAGDFAVSVWAKPLTMSGYGRVYDTYNGGGFMLQNMFGSAPINKWLFYLWNGPIGIYSNNASTGDWQHIVGVRNNGTIYMYVDGVLQTENASSSSTVNGGDLIIGAAYNTNAEFNGSIDDVMIFNRSLNAEEIVQLYGNRSTRYYTNNYTNLTEGVNYNLTVYAQDLAGNMNSSSNAVNVLIAVAGVKNVYPTSDVLVNLHDFFNVTVNVTCYNKDCGTFNVSLDPYVSSSITPNIESKSWTSIILSDDSSSMVDLGFIYTFNGASYSKVCVSSNGYLTLTNSIIGCSVIPSGLGDIGDASVAGIGGDMYPVGGNVKYYSDANQFILYYDAVGECCSGINPKTFQIKLVNGQGPEVHYGAIAGWTGFGGVKVTFLDYTSITPAASTAYKFCLNGACSSSSEKSGLVNTTIGAIPFYTNATFNPVEVTLSENQSQLITWWVNATGDDGVYEFYAYTTRGGIDNETTHYNVSIVGYPTVEFSSNSDMNQTYGRSNIFVNVSGGSTGNVSTVLDFDNSLLGWWTMDNVSGSTVIDQVGRNNGTAQGGAVQTSGGKMGKAMIFDGSGDRINVSYSSSFNLDAYGGNYTLSMWVNSLNPAGAVSCRLMEKHWSPYPISLQCNDTSVKGYVYDGTNNPSVSFGNPWDGNWHLLTFVVDAATDEIYAYRDGALVGQTINTVTSTTANNYPIYIGDGWDQARPFNGSIDDVMIFNRSLSVDEVAALYGNTTVKYAVRNFTGLAGGSHTVTGYAQSTAGLISSTGLRTITLDNIAPGVSFVSPTPLDGNVSVRDSIYVNVTSSDATGNISTFVDLNKSVVGWWRFDDTNGTGSLIDLGSLNRTMILRNYSDGGIDAGKSYFIDNAPFGRGYRFVETVQNGNGNMFITSGANNCDYANLDCGSKTISLWVRSVSGGYKGQILGTMYAGFEVQATGGWHLRMTDETGVSFIWKDDAQEFTSSYDSVSSTMVADQWHHVLVLANNTYVALYIDGVYKNSASNFGGFGEAKGTLQTDNLMLGGGYPISYLYGFNGEMDDVIIFNRSLTVAEIGALYGNSSSKYLDTNITSLRGGAYNLTAYSQDSYGNLNHTESRNITIITSPSLNIDYPLNGSIVPVSSGLELNYSFVDGGVLVGVCKYSLNGGANVTIPGCLDTTINVNQGWNNVSIYANDTLGQSASNITTFFVDSIFPTVSVYEPFDVAYSNGTNITVDVSTNEGATGSLVSNLDNSLVSWWRMDNVSESTIVDQMGRFNGTKYGAVSQIDGGKMGKAISLGGVSADYVQIPKPQNFDNVTFSAWIYINNVSANNNIFYRLNGETLYPRAYVQTGGSIGAQYRIAGTTRSIGSGPGLINSSTWSFVTFVFDEQFQYMYVNGVLNSSANYVGDLTGGSNTIWLGKDTNLPYYFNGSMDDVMIFNKSLNSAEILGLYNATRVNYNITLATGNHTYQAYAQDSAGNINASTLFGFEVDPTIPYVAFNSTTPFDGSAQLETYFNVGMNLTDPYGAYSFVDLDNSLVGYWRAEDGANDTTGRNNGTMINQTTITRNGKFGKAFSFDGNGDYITTPYSSNNGSLTVSGWINVKNVSENVYGSVLFTTQYSSDDDNGWEIGVLGRYDSICGNNDGAVYVFNGDGADASISPCSTTKLTNNQWYHIVMTYNQTNIGVYVNGVLENSSVLDLSNSSRNGAIGSRVNDNGANRFALNGSIDEVIIFNRSLSANEISQLYNKSKGAYSNQFVGLSEPATHTIKGYAVDTAGNLNTTGTRSIYVDSIITNVCRTLDEANTIYTLTGNITAMSTDCMMVGANNVTLDLNGYAIIGGALNVRGVVNTVYSNFTLKNGEISGFNYSVYSIGEALGTNISNMTFSNATIAGVYATLYNSSVSNITVTDTPYGIVLGGNYTNLTNFYSLNSSYGLDYAGAFFSGLRYGFVENGVINNSGYGRGIYIYDYPIKSEGSVFRDINISNALIGVGVTGAGDLYTEGSSFNNISITDSINTDYYLINSSLAGYNFVGNSLVVSSGYGSLNYTNTSIYASGTNMSGIFNITENNVFVNTSKNLAFNTTANITFRGLNAFIVVLPEARVDFNDDGIFEDCPESICTNLSYSGGVFIYNVTHFTSYSSEEFNTVPDTPPFVYINSSSGENISSDDLICNTYTSDPDGGMLTVSVNWYRNGTYNLTTNHAVANATYFGAVLDKGNTTKYQNWSCAVKFIDSQDSSIWVNSSNLTLVNDVPDVTIVSPTDWSDNTNRTPEFSWTVVDGDAEDTITYEFNLSDQKFAGADTCSDLDIAFNISAGYTNNYYIPEVALKCLEDNGYYYNWSVRANDGEVYGEWVTSHVNITADMTITLTTNSVNFGDLWSGNITDTLSDYYPMVIRNDGNALVNVSVNSSLLWTTTISESSYYQFKVDNVTGEPDSFNQSGSTISWRVMPITGSFIAIDQLNYNDSKDSAEIDVRLEVPPNEPPGAKLATIIFTSWLDE